ncbi:major histocompatibility complex class I-related gene protein isoform X2 [Ctenopharyngodon idella]|uniref:major histocompatibility complex class I-related gene protein isoform X2 n=1 Tax=Ctenopharyngodon idella TaxID=7959 RepID=UPI002232771D|nr:major histocompatibility complex class I-related gene protein isoform X2 [Ctenopharyngodon idella]
MQPLNWDTAVVLYSMFICLYHAEFISQVKLNIYLQPDIILMTHESRARKQAENLIVIDVVPLVLKIYWLEFTTLTLENISCSILKKMFSVKVQTCGLYFFCSLEFVSPVQVSTIKTHSLKYFFTAVSGDIDFPEFTIVGLVDEGQFIYFDSNTMKVVPKTEWMRQKEGDSYWDTQTQLAAGTHQAFRNNIQVAKERFNHSTGVHTFQEMYGCEWDDHIGATDAFRQEGYDGEDFLSLDFKEIRWITPVQQGFPSAQKWNNDRANLKGNKNYLSTVCIEWLKKYLEYGKSSLQKTVSPQVSLLQKDPSSPVTCHATGFYPRGIVISWMKNGQDHYEDVDLGELLPNEDRTFQKRSTLSVTPDEWKKNEFSCVVEHQGKTVTEKKIRTNNDPTETSVPIAMIVGAVAAVILLVVIGAVGFIVYQIKKGCFSGFKPVKPSDDSSSQRSTNTLISSGSGSSTSS